MAYPIPASSLVKRSNMSIQVQKWEFNSKKIYDDFLKHYLT